jgi:hypothetical protein
MGFIWWSIVSKAMNFRFPYNIGDLLTWAASASEEIHRSEKLLITLKHTKFIKCY